MAVYADHPRITYRLTLSVCLFLPSKIRLFLSADLSEDHFYRCHLIRVKNPLGAILPPPRPSRNSYLVEMPSEPRFQTGWESKRSWL